MTKIAPYADWQREHDDKLYAELSNADIVVRTEGDGFAGKMELAHLYGRWISDAIPGDKIPDGQGGTWNRFSASWSTVSDQGGEFIAAADDPCRTAQGAVAAAKFALAQALDQTRRRVMFEIETRRDNELIRLERLEDADNAAD